MTQTCLAQRSNYYTDLTLRSVFLLNNYKYILSSLNRYYSSELHYCNVPSWRHNCTALSTVIQDWNGLLRNERCGCGRDFNECTAGSHVSDWREAQRILREVILYYSQCCIFKFDFSSSFDYDVRNLYSWMTLSKTLNNREFEQKLRELNNRTPRNGPLKPKDKQLIKEKFSVLNR